VPASNPVHVSFFGLGNIDVYGYVNANGQFSLNGSIGFDDAVAGTGLYGSISASISNSSFSGSFSAGAKIAGQDVGSVGGSLVIETNHVHVIAWVGAIKIDFDLGSVPMTAAPSTVYWYSVPAAAHEGDTVTLNASATDSNGNQIPDGGSYHWTIFRNGQNFAAGTGAAFTLTLVDPGTYQVNLAATDPGTGSIALRSSSIAVANVPPAITSLNLQTAYASGIRQTITPSVVELSPTTGVAGLSYAWSVSRNGRLTIRRTRRAIPQARSRSLPRFP
jgi:hypothetical protein